MSLSSVSELLSPAQNGERYKLFSPTAMPKAAGFLWNKKMMLQVTCRGYAVAQHMQPEPSKYAHAPLVEGKTFMLPEQPYYVNHPGRFFYIKDEETGKIISVPYEPVRSELDKFEFSVGKHDLQWELEALEVRVRLRCSLPVDAAIELWQFSIENLSSRTRRLSVYSYFPIGYMSWMNTDQKREKEHLAQMLTLARDYARARGFKGTFLIEPKPMEPSKHQYDVDTETVIGFLKAHGLDKDFKVNIEVNHATLAGHTFEHELAVAVDNGMLGSIDANRGDYQNGWDTDQFPIDNYELTQAMMQIIRNDGLGNGGTNFDAKTRRNSTDLEDIFIAHIAGMDAMARALESAAKLLEESPYKKMLADRYASFDNGKGKEFEDGKLTLEDVVAYAKANGEPKQTSGKQELYEAIVNMYC